MRRTKFGIAVKIMLFLLAIIPFTIEWINHIQYTIRSPEKGLQTRQTLLGYSCSYDLLSQDEYGNLYARTSDAVIFFNDSGGVTVYHLGTLGSSEYIDIKHNSISVKDIKTMKKYVYDMNGNFIKCEHINDIGEIDWNTRINTKNGLYRVCDDYIFSYVLKKEKNDSSTERYILKSVNNDFIYSVYKVDYILQIILCIIHIIYIIKNRGRHHRQGQ